uniref:Uncharacterized protein n=1 Tax=Anguilla anguilla TaxID=7936 RepID=A0A0E9WA38_ANGAN
MLVYIYNICSNKSLMLISLLALDRVSKSEERARWFSLTG